MCYVCIVLRSGHPADHIVCCFGFDYRIKHLGKISKVDMLDHAQITCKQYM